MQKLIDLASVVSVGKNVNGKLLTTEGKEVAHQGMLFDIL